VIPSPHRGGALVLGTRQPGDAGPFGPYDADEHNQEHPPGRDLNAAQPLRAPGPDASMRAEPRGASYVKAGVTHGLSPGWRATQRRTL